MEETSQKPKLNFDIWCIVFQIVSAHLTSKTLLTCSQLAEEDRQTENSRLWTEWEEEYV
jgi:hypothetical protein